MRPPVVGFRHPSFRRCKYFAPYRGDIKPPLEVVVMTLDLSKIDSLNYKPADRESEGFSEGAFIIVDSINETTVMKHIRLLL